jgi:hypothetical protein
MTNELKNQTLVAAELAKQSGFENTYLALMNLVRSELVPEHKLPRSSDREVVN